MQPRNKRSSTRRWSCRSIFKHDNGNCDASGIEGIFRHCVWKCIRACSKLLPARASRTIGANLVMVVLLRIAEDDEAVRSAAMFVIFVLLLAFAFGERCDRCG